MRAWPVSMAVCDKARLRILCEESFEDNAMASEPAAMAGRKRAPASSRDMRDMRDMRALCHTEFGVDPIMKADMQACTTPPRGCGPEMAVRTLTPREVFKKRRRASTRPRVTPGVYHTPAWVWTRDGGQNNYSSRSVQKAA